MEAVEGEEGRVKVNLIMCTYLSSVFLETSIESLKVIDCIVKRHGMF